MLQFIAEYHGLICFGIGMVVGGMGGIVLMALLFIGREYDENTDVQQRIR